MNLKRKNFFKGLLIVIFLLCLSVLDLKPAFADTSGAITEDDVKLTSEFIKSKDYNGRQINPIYSVDLADSTRSILVKAIDSTKLAPNNVISVWAQTGSSEDIFTISAPNVANYKLASNETATKTGTYGIDSEIIFLYEPVTTTVTIIARDRNNSPVEGYVDISVKNIKIGTSYWSVAPIIPGYEIADGQYRRSIQSVSITDNKITFIYKKITGNILVKAVESGNSSNVIGVWSDTAVVGANYTPTEQSFIGWQSLPAGTITVDKDSNKNIIEIPYTKQMGLIVIEAVDERGELLQLNSQNITAQVGTRYIGGMLTVPNYTLADGEEISKAINVSGISNTITFVYKKMSSEVVVIHKDKVTGSVLGVVTMPLNAGDNYAANAMTIDNYILAPGEPAVQSGIVPGSGTLTVEFLYDKHADNVAIQIINVKDNSVMQILYENAKYASETTITAPHVPGFELQGNRSETFVLTSGNQKIVQFYYKYIVDIVAEKYISVTIKGLSDELYQRELYSYTVKVQKNINQIILALKVPLYTLKDVSQNKNGDVLGEHVVNSAADMTYSFLYKKNTADITVNAYVFDTTTQVQGFAPIKINYEIDQKFSFDSPSIPGWVLVNGLGGQMISQTKEITVTSSNNVINFYYKRAEGNITVIYKDADTGNEIGRESSYLSNNVPTTIAIKEIENYTAKSTTAIMVTYDGINNVSDIVYEYTRNTVSLNLVAYNSITKAQITLDNANNEVSPVVISDIRVLEVYDYTADIMDIAGYTVVPNGNTKALASTTNGEVIKIYYEPVTDSEVIVEIREGSKSGSLLQTYKINAAKGETVTIPVPTISGYIYDSANEDNNIWTIAGSEEKIIFIMTDTRHKVTVTTIKDNGTPEPYSVEKVINGSGININTPYLAGYILAGYELDGLYYPAERGGTNSVTIDNVTADASLIFKYSKIEDVVDQYSVILSVKGMAGTTELYSYSIAKGKNSGTTTVDAFSLSGYKLDGAAFYDFEVEESNLNHIFTYKDLATKVKINAVDQQGNPIQTFTPFYVNAVSGQPFSYRAPYVAGYDLTDSSIGAIVNVDDTDNELTFTYNKAVGNVMLLLKENDTDGAVIKSETIEFYPDEKKIIALPDLTADFYIALSTAIEVQYTGSPVTVEYYYEKQLGTVKILAVDTADNSEITSITTDKTYRLGEVSSFYAPIVSNEYALADSTPRLEKISTDGQGVIFKYKKATEGQVVVEAVYENDAEQQSIIYDYVINSTKDNVVSIDAPQLLGYKLKDTDTTRQTSIVPGKIRFVYVKDAVTVAVRLESAKDSTKELHAPAGFNNVIEVARGLDYTVYAPHIDGYMISGSQNESFLKLESNKNVTFRYIPLEDVVDQYSVILTINGMAGTTELYRYSISKGKNSGTTTVDAFSLNGYRLTGAASYGFEVKENNLTHTFMYDSLATEVKINAIDQQGNPLQNFTPFYVNAVKDQPFSYNAPYVTGYDLAGSSIGKITSVDDTDNQLTFTYKKSVGNAMLLLKENDTNGAVIKSEALEFYSGEKKIIAIPDLSADFYTALSTAIEVQYTGSPVTVEYYYEKQLGTVKILAVDTADNSEITSITTNKTYRLGEVSSFFAPIVSNEYALADSTPKLVKISTDGEEVIFKYKKTTEGQVVVEAVYEDDAEQQSIIYDYVINSTKDNVIAVDAPQLLGYKLKDVNTAKQTSIVPGTIRFVYVKDAVTITVRLESAKDSTKELQAPANFNKVIEVARGIDYTVYAPHIDGYMISGSQNQSFSKLESDKNVTFKYTPVEDVADQYSVILTIKGMAGTTELYSYSLTKGKNFGDFTAEAFYVSGYRLIDADKEVEILNVQNVNIIHTFEYETLATSVIIKAQLEDGNEIPEFIPIIVPAVKGQPFSYTAPYIKGYELVDDGTVPVDVTQVIDSVIGNESLIFNYKKADGNLTVILKEQSGDIIKAYSQTLTADQPETIEIPELKYYTAVDTDPETITYVDTDLTITYEYIRDTRNVKVVLVDEQGFPIEEITASESDSIAEFDSNEMDYRIGEVTTFTAPQIEGYALADANEKLVFIEEGTTDQEVIFKYKSLKEDEVAVVAVHNSDILFTYIMKTQTGANVTSSSPRLLGYKLAEGQKTSQSSTAPGIIIFEYVKDVVTVTVNLIDKDGNKIQGPVGYTMINEVANGGNYTAYAPHINGYILDLTKGQKVDFVNLSDSQVVTFVYESLDDYVDDNYHVIIIKTAFDIDSNTSMGTPELTKVAKGQPQVISAPFFEGYTAVSYIINGEEEVEGNTFYTDQLEENIEIQFNFKKDDEVIVDPIKPGKPMINPVKTDDTVITGEGTPGNKIIVTFPDKSTEETTVKEDGKWELTIPDGVKLNKGDEINAVEKDKDENSSDEAKIIVIQTNGNQGSGGKTTGSSKSTGNKADDIKSASASSGNEISSNEESSVKDVALKEQGIGTEGYSVSSELETVPKTTDQSNLYLYLLILLMLPFAVYFEKKFAK